MILGALKEKKKISNLFKTIKYDQEFRKNNPDYFYPSQFICFIGNQGGGKTLTAVNYLYKLMEWYPKCKLITNIDITAYPIDNKRVFRFETGNDLTKYKNGTKGVIFFIDEIHLYFGSQKGNNNINPEVVQTICQQRKQRIHVIGTTQYFAQLNINLRRHFDTIILCESKFFAKKQKLSVIERNDIDSKETSDQTLNAKVSYTYSFWRAPYMFERYDTYALIENNNLKVGLERSETNDNTNIELSNNIRITDNNSTNSTTNSSNILGWKHNN